MSNQDQYGDCDRCGMPGELDDGICVNCWLLDAEEQRQRDIKKYQDENQLDLFDARKLNYDLDSEK